MAKRTNNEVGDLLAKIDDPLLLKNVLANLLTPAEYRELEMRLKIFKLLKRGVTQRDIAGKLGVSLATISRGSRELKYGKPGIKAVLAEK